MNLYIRVVDGQPFEHPITEENMRFAFPEVNLETLPDNFARFVRVAPPAIGPYEKNQTVSYELNYGAYTDVFSVEQMTAEEITAKQQAVQADWEGNSGPASWAFNAETCAYEAPIAKPDEENNYVWRESDLSWVYVPQAPEGEGWAFNVETGLWNKA